LRHDSGPGQSRGPGLTACRQFADEIGVADQALERVANTLGIAFRNDDAGIADDFGAALGIRRHDGTASVHSLQQAWSHPLVDLSCELEGHPLGGGMLKLEPREAANVRLPVGKLELTSLESLVLRDAIQEMRHWRHYA